MSLPTPSYMITFFEGDLVLLSPQGSSLKLSKNVCLQTIRDFANYAWGMNAMTVVHNYAIDFNERVTPLPF